MSKTFWCDGCGKPTEHTLSRYCGAWLCDECDHHRGLCRCFCGWSLSGADGRKELEDMGERIEEDY
jgi:hypothetical protein